MFEWKLLIDIYGCEYCGGTFYVNPGDMMDGQVNCPYCLSPMAFFEGKATITSADFTPGIMASLSGPVTRIFLADDETDDEEDRMNKIDRDLE